MIRMHSGIFTLGILMFIVSFFIPIDDTGYGYSLALLVFDIRDKTFPQAVWGIFMVGITNLAALITILAYYRFFKRWISLLGVVGSCVAIFWMQDVVSHGHFLPWATICWTVGILLLTAGYELKRRQQKTRDATSA